MRRVALAFMAHPDDAEILCAGTLARLALLGEWEIHIATATAGDCGSATLDGDQIASVRRREAEASATIIGARYHCLSERNALVVYDKPTIGKTIELFRTVAPSLVFTHALRDYMMDHEVVAQLARAASFAYPARNVSSLPLVEGSAVPHLYYCDPIDGLDPLGQTVQPTTVIDITETIDTKTQMLAAHASQREWLRVHHGIDQYIQAMRRHADRRGKLLGTKFAEAFVQHRGHAYPADDLLVELFPAAQPRGPVV